MVKYQEPATKIAIAEALMQTATRIIAEAMLLRHAAGVERGQISTEETFEQFVKIDLDENYDLVSDVLQAVDIILQH